MHWKRAARRFAPVTTTCPLIGARSTDTSRQGSYHNQRFKALAELVLHVDHDPTLWSTAVKHKTAPPASGRRHGGEPGSAA